MIHIPKGSIVTSDGTEVTAWSGFIHFDPDKDRDEGYGIVDDVLAIMGKLTPKGRGLSLRYTVEGAELTKPIVIRDASLRGRKIWFHVAESNA